MDEILLERNCLLCTPGTVLLCVVLLSHDRDSELEEREVRDFLAERLDRDCLIGEFDTDEELETVMQEYDFLPEDFIADLTENS